MKLKSLSIFFPAFNEEKNIPIVVEQALKVAPKVSEKFEIIIVDDGSHDKTAEVVEKLSNKYKAIRLIKHKNNLGYGSALRTGFYNSKYEYITYMDSDGQFNFSEIQKLIENIRGADLAVGYRIKRADSLSRRIIGKLWNFLLWNLLFTILFRMSIKDMDCGFKLMKRKVIDEIPKLTSTGATISAELLIQAKRNGFKISQVGLNHLPRLYGKNTHGNPLHWIRAYIDVILLFSKIGFWGNNK